MASLGLPAGIPGGGVGAGGAPTTTPWTPGNVPRPDLNPLNPQAAYDPEIAKSLANQRAFGQDIKAGTGFAMDVLQGQRRDTASASLEQARADAAAQGIPFDEQKWQSEQLRGENAAMAQDKLAREQMYGQELGAEAGTSEQQAGERTQRLNIDLDRQIQQNAQALDRYGKDIQKYGVDAQAATAANTALMDYYRSLMQGQFGLMGSMFGALGSMGGGGGAGFQSNYSFG